MLKIIIKYEPLLGYIYGSLVFAFCVMIGISIKSLQIGSLLIVVMILLIIEFVLWGINYILSRDNILAILTTEGCFIEGKRLIKWEEIISWKYYPGGRYHLNSLKFETIIGNRFEIKGFSYRKMIKAFKYYVPEKQI